MMNSFGLRSKRPTLNTLLPAPAYSLCWHTCGASFLMVQFTPSPAGFRLMKPPTPKMVSMVDASLCNYRGRDRSKEGFQTDRCSFYKANPICYAALCHREKAACCCWVSCRLLIRYHAFSVQEMLRGTESSW